MALLSLLPIIGTFLLLFTGLGLFLLHQFQPNFRFSWILATSASIAAWLLILLSRAWLPISIPLSTWSSNIFYTTSPALKLDGFSWPITLGLATIGLAVILTDIVRTHEEDWSSWASSLVLISMGMIAAMASNQDSLMIAWGAIDLYELLLWMAHINSSEIRERVVLFFSMRVIGLMLVLLASTNNSILFLAVILRLSVVPFQLPGIEIGTIRRGLGTIVHLVPAISCINLLVRIATEGKSNQSIDYLLIFTIFGAIYTGVRWLFAKNELDGRPFLILSMAFLAISAAARGQPVACLVFGLGLIFEGSFIFLYSVRNRSLKVLAWVAFIVLSSLPFTPTWDSARLFAAPLTTWMLVFIAPQALILSGYIRHSVRKDESFSKSQHVEVLIYSLGLTILIIVHISIGYWSWPALLEAGTGYIYSPSRNPIETWAGAVAILLLLTIFLFKRFIRIKLPFNNLRMETPNIASLLYDLSKWFFQLLNYVVNATTSIIEGDGGLLWTLLLLVLLLAFFAQGGLGG
jgi:hypothetical protein